MTSKGYIDKTLLSMFPSELVQLMLTYRKEMMTRTILTGKSVPDDLVAVFEERSVSSPLFADFFPANTRSTAEMQRDT